MDNLMAEGTKRLAPEYSVYDLAAPEEVSDSISLPKPEVAMISNWIYHGQQEIIRPETLARMQELFSA